MPFPSPPCTLCIRGGSVRYGHLVGGSLRKADLYLASGSGGPVDAVHDDVGPDDLFGGDGRRTALADRVGERLRLLLEPVNLLIAQLWRDVHQHTVLVPVDLQWVQLQPALRSQEVALAQRVQVHGPGDLEDEHRAVAEPDERGAELLHVQLCRVPTPG